MLIAARMPALTRLLGRVGEHTLPVYVLHMPVLAMLHHGLVAGGAPDLGWAGVLLPPVATAAVTLACLALHRLALTLGLTWLFRMPSRPALGARRAAGRAFDAGRRRFPTGAPAQPGHGPRVRTSSHSRRRAVRPRTRAQRRRGARAGSDG